MAALSFAALAKAFWRRVSRCAHPQVHLAVTEMGVVVLWILCSTAGIVVSV